MSYVALKLNGSGYATITDASQKGLDIGLSDFMIEGWVKTSTTGVYQTIMIKYTGGVGYHYTLKDTTGAQRLVIDDGGAGYAEVLSNTAVNDGKWHYIAVVLDRGGNAYFYLDGSADGSGAISAHARSLNNNATLYLGIWLDGSSIPFIGSLDEIRIWNFGYGGLPADYAAYIAWREQGRNIYLPISSYNSGSWNGYVDALRTTLLTNGTMEAVNSWANRGTPTTNARSADQAHGGGFSRKIVTDAVSEGARQDVTTIVGEWYEVCGWVWVTAGDAKIGKEDTDGSDQVLAGQATAGAWNQFCVVFQATATTSRIFFQSDATANSTFYVDDMLVHRIGLVARWKMEGDYTDETSNSNDLTAGGSGNIFLPYTWKKQRIIIPKLSWIK